MIARGLLACARRLPSADRARSLHAVKKVAPCCYTLLQTSDAVGFFPGPRGGRQVSYYTFPLIVGVQDALESMHAFTNLPWWATITLTTIALRTAITLPLAVKQNVLLTKIEILKPTISEILIALKESLSIKGQRSGKTVDEIRKQVQKESRLHVLDVYKRNGCHPLKLFILPWVQLPLWITLSLALRNISGCAPNGNSSDGQYLPSLGMKHEGTLWFPDLSVADPCYLLPTLLLLTNLMNIEMNCLKLQSPTKLNVVMTQVFRGLTFLVFIIATQLPSAISLYWVASSTFGLAQNLMLKSPKIRRFLNIPKTPSEKDRPYLEMAEILRARLRNFVEIQKRP